MVVLRLNKKSKIGIFDSGLGGLSVLKTLSQLLPNESFIYIGDSKNAPYGTKTKEEVFELSKIICDQLIAYDVKAIVIACNTATSAAVTQLRDLYSIPIIGMEPAVKPALKQSTGPVVVIATEMTLKEEKFLKLVDSLEDGYRIVKLPAPEWVDCVENHMSDVDFTKSCVNSFLEQHIPNAQNMVLDCTHYIFLKEYIRAFYGGKIEIFDGNIGTALQLKNTLESQNCLADENVLVDEGPLTDDISLADVGKNFEDSRIVVFNTKSDEHVTKSYDMLTALGKGV